jgi:hypothetical protein
LPVLGIPLEETLCSCPSDFLQSRSKVMSVWAEVCSHVYIIPDEAWLDWVYMLSFWDMIFCFQSGFQRIRSRTVLIVAWALIFFRHSEQALSSTLQRSL